MLFIVATVVMMVMVMMLNVAHSSMYDMIFVVTKTKTKMTKTKTKMTKTLKITFHSSGTTSASPGIHITGSN